MNTTYSYINVVKHINSDNYPRGFAQSGFWRGSEGAGKHEGARKIPSFSPSGDTDRDFSL